MTLVVTEMNFLLKANKSNCIGAQSKGDTFGPTLSKELECIVVSVGQHFERVLEQLEGAQGAGSG